MEKSLALVVLRGVYEMVHPLANKEQAERMWKGYCQARDKVVRIAAPEPPTVLGEWSDSPSCRDCGGIMTRSGSCYRCGNCGESSGCG